MSILKKDDGSITIEATLIIPILLTFFLILISIVKIGIAEMALQEAVSDTAQSVAHYSYLAMEGQNKIKKKTDSFVDSLTSKTSNLLGNHDIVDYLLKELAGAGKKQIPTSGDIANYYSDEIFEFLVKENYSRTVANTSFFNPTGVKVVDSSFPRSVNGEEANVKIVAENTLKIVMPFYEKELKIKKTAVERGWVGN
mgnify:CR=1 FL=1